MREGSVVAITGATGFVGAHVLEHARDAFVPIILSRSKKPIGLDTRQWSASDPVDTMAGALRGIDVVCHMAAYVPRDLQDPDEAERCLAINTLGTLSLVRACRQAGVRRLVHLSSGNILVRRERLVREDDSVSAVNPHAPYYLGSKALAEGFVRGHAGPDLEVMVLRPSAIYGPGMRENMITIFAQRLARGEPVTVRDGGRYEADLVDVRDVARMVIAAALSDRVGIVNVGSGVVTSVLDVAHALCRLTGADPGLVHVEPETDAPPTGFAALDLERARDWFGFEPTALEDGLRHYLRSLTA
ncbi:MAG TPA: NAD-dependent epimerase/dehydratase family protein [Longimicrobiales bacterium]